MAVAVIMPRQGQSVESCIITKWNKKVGDKVAVGDVLFAYETDKASFEEEAKDAGTLLAIFAEEGDDVPVLENVAVIGAEGEDTSVFASGAPAESAKEEPAAKAEVPVTSPAAAAVATGAVQAGEKVKISPRAKSIAENQNLDLGQAVPTGPNGRIIERDVLELSRTGAVKMEGTETAAVLGDAVSKAPIPVAAAGEFEDIPLTNVRKKIAKAMHNSLQSMAQLTHSASFDATDILAYRKKVKESGEALGLANITLNDIVLFAVSRTLKNHRDMNAHYLDDTMRLFNQVNLGMAVDTPRGLLVPTIFGADTMTLNEIATEAKRLAREAQDGKISPDYLTGGTFTISNLGAFGTENFTPIINPPQTGILGVCTVDTKLKMVEGNAIPYQSMGLSLTYDHRAVDGAPAARFLQDVCNALANFSVLLAK